MKLPKIKFNKHGTRMKSSRELVLERDKSKCVVCGEKDLEVLTIDHKIPKSVMKAMGYQRRARYDTENLQVMCLNCQHKKRDKVTLEVYELFDSYVKNAKKRNFPLTNKFRKIIKSFRR